MRIRKRFFNLIEIVLAMGVVVVGMTGILAMLPPALDANRDATAETLAAEAASKMSAYLQIMARTDWETNILGGKIDATAPTELAVYSNTELSTIRENLESNKSGARYNNDPTIYYHSTRKSFFVFSGDYTNVVEVKMWRENPPDFYVEAYENGTNVNYLDKYITRIHMMISWPTAMKWSSTAADNRRQSRTFVCELARPEGN